MSTRTIQPQPAAHPLIKPEPRSAIAIRPAVEAGGRDLKFIDSLMKQHAKMVGFASMKELQSHIDEGTGLIAVGEDRLPVGYLLYRDRYMKREDCGYVSQLNVLPSKHRGLVGAALVQAMFERVPYGVRLFCCWCAQDLEANHFWEAIGFVPLAYRTGGRGKEHGGRRARGTRLHIFWQRRVRDGDDYAYWFPSQTVGGRMGEPRLVLPIEPGTHWSDVKLVVLPGMERMDEAKALEGEGQGGAGEATKVRRQRVKKVKSAPIVPGKTFGSGGLRFGPPETVKAEKAPKPKREKQPPRKNDPNLVAAAREFRDRYLEQVNAEGGDRLLASNGKYEISRRLESAPSVQSMPLLNAA